MDLNVPAEISLFLSYVPMSRSGEMTRNSNTLTRDGSVMLDSDLVEFFSGSTDSAINFSGSVDFHTPIHPPLEDLDRKSVV